MTAPGAVPHPGAPATGTAAATRRPGRPVPADLLTIGEVLAELQDDFPEVTHSKIRFLEERGLVTPARTPSGYRKFARRDVERLRLVLSLQRDQYLPLKVIGDHLAALDAGQVPPTTPSTGRDGGPAVDGRGAPEEVVPATATSSAPAGPPPERRSSPVLPPPGPRVAAGRGPSLSGSSSSPGADLFSGSTSPTGATSGGALSPTGTRPDSPLGRSSAGPVELWLSRSEVVTLAGGDAALVEGLESHGLLPPPVSGQYPAEAGHVVRAARDLAGYGIEPRHLRVLRTAAEREASLVEQVVSPLRRSARAGTSERAGEVTREITETMLRLHGALLRSALDSAGS